MRDAHSILVAAFWILIAGGVGMAAELPRYSLPVGRKLTYSSSSDSKSIGAENRNDMRTTAKWQITVVRANPDGSRRVILRMASTFSQSFGDQKHDSPERVQLAYADVFPDGRVLPNKSLGMHLDLSGVLPPLPADEAQLARGWSSRNEDKMETNSYTPQAGSGSGSAPGEVVFTAVTDGVMNKIYATTSKQTFHFDPAKGAVTSAEGEMTQDYGFHSKGTSTTKLESDETVPADEAATSAADYDVLFDAKGAYEEKMGAVEKDPGNADALIAAAQSAVETARKQAKSQGVKSELDRILKDHAQYATYAKEGAGRFKDVLDKPAFAWETTDIDGKPAKLADYRGKVVVMDFWYRGCGWCMYAMPQLRQLSESFADKPVIVLGMNTDGEESDARFVIDTMKLKYPTIKAMGIPEKYGVQGFPTLITVDQEGIVRDVHVGFSPTLRQDVGKKIDELLAKTANAAR